MRVAERIRAQSIPAGTVAIWWLGQNSYLVKGADFCTMLDPFFSRPGDPARYLYDQPPVRPDELQPDAVLCTHNHSDHTDPGFLLPLAQHSPATRFCGPAESAQAMHEAGIAADRVRALASGEVIPVGAASVHVVLSKTPAVSDVAHFGYIIELAGVKVYDTGDIMRGVTREPTLMEPLRRAAPHIALITTSPTEEEFPDFDEAAQLAIAIGARVAVPAHYGCFARRTFDPSPFAGCFGESATTRAEIIPYCGCLLFAAGEARG
jgi:L-ascorbate metabolism protein UlaG (beta-lactamase superfamily)